MIAYLQKSEGSKGFHQIIDFLNRIATTKTSATGEVELTAIIDGQEKTITEASLRRHLKLEDNGGVTTLPNSEIFEQLAIMGYATYSDKLTFQKAASMPHESPLQSVHSLRRDKGSLSLHELMKDKSGLSDEEEVSEDPSKQERSLIKELDLDSKISLVSPHDAKIQEKISDDTEVTTVDTTLNTASVPISTASPTPEDSIAAANLVYIRRSAEKRKDKGKAIMIEDESVQKKSKKQLEQERISHEEAIRLQEQIDEEERKRIARDDVISYHALQHRPISVAEVRKNMIMYLKNQGGYKMKDFKGMSYDDIRPIFKNVWEQVHSFVPMDSEEEVQRLKRAGQDVEARPAKRQRTKEVSESVQEQADEKPKTDELSQEQLNQMVIIVPDEGINVEALQTKYPIIGWEVYSEDTMQFWKIIRVGDM
ncbi:hypothetical protein Tco_0859147 [Tanacetum coccineum]|uniref:Uncharacterized protein n=1 Tax=Tanacetum coccineum TaxID=301880 RepID=A0ABQ5BB57_9ASTR